MTPGYLLQIGDALQSSDLRLHRLGDDGNCAHLTQAEGPQPVGSTGGIVTARHGHFFRPYTKPELPNPDVEKAQAALTDARNQIAALNASNVKLATRNVQLEAVNEELRRQNRPIYEGEGGKIPWYGTPTIPPDPQAVELLMRSSGEKGVDGLQTQ